MKSVVDPVTARRESSPNRETNHPFPLFCLARDQTVVREEAARGFTRARKIAPRLIGGSVVAVAVRCRKDDVPTRYWENFRKINIQGTPQECYLVGCF